MKRLFILLCAIGYNLILVAQTCPIDEQLKSLKEEKLSEKTISVYKTEESFVVEVADIPIATFALLCDVYHKDFEKWKQNSPNAETYTMFSCKYDSKNNIAGVTMYYRALNPQIPLNPTDEWVQQLNKTEQELQNEALIVLKKAEAIRMMQEVFDTRGVEDLFEYDPSLYYCGTDAVSDPNERGWIERKVVSQSANVACFVHDKQYLILGFDKGVSDKIFNKNTFIELIQKGYNKHVAKGLSDTYYRGVNLLGHAAYLRAQNEAKTNQKK
jgi:hypothetical protein